MSKDDIKLPKLTGGTVFEKELYFDAKAPSKKPLKRSQSLSNIKLEYDEFYDAYSNDPSERSRSNSQSSLGNTSVESFSSDRGSPSPQNDKIASPSVKALRARYEGNNSSPQKEPLSPTKAMSGIYAGKDINEIKEIIREVIDPHTYQQSDTGEINKGHYGKNSKNNIRR